MSERKLIQHVTTHLQRAHYNGIKYPVDHDTINDTYDKLKELRELMYKLAYPKDNKVRKVRDIVLITYNMSTRLTTDIYLQLRPPFQLIVQSPMVLYEDREDVETIYEYTRNDSDVLFHDITPQYYNLDTVSLEVVEDMRRTIDKGLAVVLGPEEKKIGNIHFINDLSKIPDNVSIVVDTMLNEKYEYINFAESIDRLYSFENVLYYRLMDSVTFSNLSMSNKVDKEKIILEALLYDERLSMLFSNEELIAYNQKIEHLNLSINDKKYMSVYNLGLLPSVLYNRAIRSNMNKVAYAFLAILFSNVDYVKDIISYPTLTDDDSFNNINKTRMMKLIKENFGSGLSLYITLLRRIVDTIDETGFDKTVFRQNMYDMLQDNHINSRVVSNIFSRMMNEFSIEMDEIHNLLSLRDYDITKMILSIYTKKIQLIGTYYYDDIVEYSMDKYYVPQSYVTMPESITPIVVDEDKKLIHIFL